MEENIEAMTETDEKKWETEKLDESNGKQETKRKEDTVKVVRVFKKYSSL